MTDTLVNIAKVAFVAGLYLFLFFVARAVRGHVSAEAPAKSRRTEAPAPLLALVVTSPESNRRTIEIRRPLVVGRGANADIALEDAFASDRHARFDTTDGRLFVEDLGSTNGTIVNGEAVTRRTPLAAGDTIRIGGTIMEVR
jgi:pSer/pThr/pTyr-binding forkhead associated (FHA) protein